MTLKDGLSSANSLNLVRLVLASLVIVAHTWPLGGFESQWGGEPPVAAWAVGGFFCLSGYLIAGSRMRLAFLTYLRNRAVRILPGVWVCLVVTAFVLAPIAAFLEGGSWSSGSAMMYVVQNASLDVNQRGIEATLQTVPYPVAWNGSLWTLFFEFGAYLAAGALLTGALRRRPLLLTSALLVGATAVAPWADEHVSTNLYTNALLLGTFFLAGMVLYFAADRLPASLGAASACVIAFAGLTVAGWETWLGPLPLAYLLLVVGARIPARWVQTHDVSYGVYIYAFPVQQLLAVLGAQGLGLLSFMALSLIGTIPLAWASWLLVERPAMRLKRTLRTPPIQDPGSGRLRGAVGQR